jgi:hypothetical protein
MTRRKTKTKHMIPIQKHLNLLGHIVEDKVTGFRGVVVSLKVVQDESFYVEPKLTDAEAKQ